MYRSSNPGLPLRMYFLMYEECSEEHKYLLGLRREKNAFTRLIEEHAVRRSMPDGTHCLTPSNRKCRYILVMLVRNQRQQML